MTTRFNPGDIVRSLTERAPHRNVGDVFTVLKISPFGGIYYSTVHGDADTFELIARAGEPVRYQPGDVVELVEDDGCERKGQRFTVIYYDDQGVEVYSPQGYLHCNTKPREMIRAHRCKLVHRPAKSEPLVFTSPEPQVGDRVRVTVEGKVRKAHDHGGLNVVLDGGPFSTPFSAKELAEGKVEVIERAEKPLAVGDRVRSYRAEFATGEIIGLRGDKAWVEVNPDRTYTTFTSNLERVS